MLPDKHPISAPAGRILLLTALLLIAPGAKRDAGLSIGDGAWWNSVGQHEQSGFLDGFLDCYTSDYGGVFDPVTADTQLLRSKVTLYYDEHPRDHGLRVADVIRYLRQPGTSYGKSTHPPSRSDFRGLYWRQQFVVGGHDEQRGFIEGYLACLEVFLPSLRITFSRTPEEYVSAVTRRYGFNEATGDIDERQESAPISKVLRIVRNTPRWE